MVYEYKWKYVQYPVPAQEAGEYMQKLTEEEGILTASSLLRHSRAEDALLHPCFEWNDSKAAEMYRLKQAGEIIRNVVTVAVDGKPIEEVKAFACVTERSSGSEGAYSPIVEALGSEETRSVVLRNALRELNWFRKKYKRLSELSEVFNAIDRVESIARADT